MTGESNSNNIFRKQNQKSNLFFAPQTRRLLHAHLFLRFNFGKYSFHAAVDQVVGSIFCWSIHNFNFECTPESWCNNSLTVKAELSLSYLKLDRRAKTKRQRLINSKHYPIKILLQRFYILLPAASYIICSIKPSQPYGRFCDHLLGHYPCNDNDVHSKENR